MSCDNEREGDVMDNLDFECCTVCGLQSGNNIALYVESWHKLRLWILREKTMISHLLRKKIKRRLVKHYHMNIRDF